MKKCSKCGTQKPLTEFSKDKTKKGGLRSNCKTCKAQHYAQYYVENKEKILEQKVQYYVENKERRAEYDAQYRAKNKEKIAQYRSENKEKILEQQAQYRAENKEKILERAAQYRAENKEKILERAVQYYAKNKEKIAQYRSENKEKIAQYYEENKEKILERAAQYRAERKSEQPSCVYQIKNLINNKIYIGETTRGELRWEQHLRSLRGNYHKNSPLQEDFNKYGEEAFEWSILKQFEDEDKNNLLLEEARSIQQHIEEGVELYNLMLTIDQIKMLTEEK